MDAVRVGIWVREEGQDPLLRVSFLLSLVPLHVKQRTGEVMSSWKALSQTGISQAWA